MAFSHNELVGWLRFVQVMAGLKRGWFSILVGGFCLIAISEGLSQEVTTVNGSKPATEIIGDTGAPYNNLFRSLSLGGPVLAPKIGPGQGSASVPLLTVPRVNLPLIQRGFRPEDAELKIGRFYLDIRQLSTSFLFSDNVNVTETGRKNGYIGIARLDVAALFQVNDGLQLAVAGALVYLPLQNKAGIAGFGIRDPLDVFLGAAPAAQAQIAYDFLLAGWNVRVYDDFRVTDPAFQAQLRLDQQFSGTQFKDQDIAGRYIYQDTTGLGTLGDNRLRGANLNIQDLEYHNTLGFSATRYVPMATRATVDFRHENVWYNNNSRKYSNRDAGTVQLVSERENLRFKPFARYETTTDNLRKGWDHQLRVGVFGPITENMDFLGDTGYYWSDDSKANTMLWRLLVNHTIGPRTSHSLEYGRTVTEPARDIADYARYTLRQVLARDITGELIGEWRRFHNLRTSSSSATEWLAGVRLTYDISPRTDFRATGYYITSTTEATPRLEVSRLTGRLEFTRHHSETLQSTLTYQYEQHDSNTAGQSYYENLAVLTIRKSF